MWLVDAVRVLPYLEIRRYETRTMFVGVMSWLEDCVISILECLWTNAVNGVHVVHEAEKPHLGWEGCAN